MISTDKQMHGYRARIGYTSPMAATEVFPYEFYRMVPKGVTLVLSTLAVLERTADEVDRSYDISLKAAQQIARTKIDLMVLGGVPINLARGTDPDAQIAEVEKQIGSASCDQYHGAEYCAEDAGRAQGCHRSPVHSRPGREVQRVPHAATAMT